MEPLPDWSDLDDDIRIWVQAQPLDRQTMWVGLRNYSEVKKAPSILSGLVRRYRDNDAICAAIAGTGSLSAEEQAMDEMEFYQLCVKRSQQNYENEKAAARGEIFD